MANVSRELVPAPLRRRARGTGRGRGAKWKVHTPEAMCKAAFANLHSSYATKAADGSCASHAMKCTWSVANIITDTCEQATGKLKRPLARDAASGLVMDDFHINNIMFDETQLWMREGGRARTKKRRRVLGIASQVTRRAPGDSTKDVDILRPPATMVHYTAATCAGIVAMPEDSAGLLPLGEAAPNAKYFASLMACLLYTSPSPRDRQKSRMPSSA